MRCAISMVVVSAIALSPCGCNDSRPAGPPPPPPKAEPQAQRPSCEKQPFADSIPVAEASGAAYVGADKTIVVVSDSGNNGAFAVIEAATGKLVDQGKLPLDAKGSDDLEGVSQYAGELFGITSSGWLRRWKKDGGSYSLVESYSVGDTGCQPTEFNCGYNFEGLCLREQSEPCAGFVVSKRNGALVCLHRDANQRLSLAADHSIRVSGQDTLSGCHFSTDGEIVWVGSNLFGGNQVFKVTGWRSPASTVVNPMAFLGPGSAEAVAVDDQRIYRFSDTSSSPSLAAAYRCE